MPTRCWRYAPPKGSIDWPTFTAHDTPSAPDGPKRPHDVRQASSFKFRCTDCARSNLPCSRRPRRSLALIRHKEGLEGKFPSRYVRDSGRWFSNDPQSQPEGSHSPKPIPPPGLPWGRPTVCAQLESHSHPKRRCRRRHTAVSGTKNK